MQGGLAVWLALMNLAMRRTSCRFGRTSWRLSSPWSQLVHAALPWRERTGSLQRVAWRFAQTRSRARSASRLYVASGLDAPRPVRCEYFRPSRRRRFYTADHATHWLVDRSLSCIAREFWAAGCQWDPLSGEREVCWLGSKQR